MPISPSQDTPGPMARDLPSAVALLDAIAGPDALDLATLHSALRIPARGFSSLLSTRPSFAGLRIGWPKDIQSEGALRAAEELKKAGAELVEVSFLPRKEYEQLGKLEGTKLMSEFVEAVDGFFLANLDSSTPSSVPRTFQGVTEFNATNEKEMEHNQDLLLASLASPPTSTPDGRKAWEGTRALASRIDEVLRENNLDCMFASLWSGYSSICGVLGYPVITGWCFEYCEVFDLDLEIKSTYYLLSSTLLIRPIHRTTVRSRFLRNCVERAGFDSGGMGDGAIGYCRREKEGSGGTCGLWKVGGEAGSESKVVECYHDIEN